MHNTRLTAEPLPRERPAALPQAERACKRIRRPPCAAIPPASPAPAPARSAAAARCGAQRRTTKSPNLRLFAISGSALWSISKVGGASTTGCFRRVSTTSRRAATEPSMQRIPRKRRLGQASQLTKARKHARTHVMHPSRKYGMCTLAMAASTKSSLSEKSDTKTRRGSGGQIASEKRPTRPEHIVAASSGSSSCSQRLMSGPHTPGTRRQCSAGSQACGLRTREAALAVIEVLFERQRVRQVDRRLRSAVSASRRVVACGGAARRTSMSTSQAASVAVNAPALTPVCAGEDHAGKSAERQPDTRRGMLSCACAAHQVAGPQRDALLQRNDASDLVEEKYAAAREGQQRPCGSLLHRERGASHASCQVPPAPRGCSW